jgi:hypothetical protein
MLWKRMTTKDMIQMNRSNRLRAIKSLLPNSFFCFLKNNRVRLKNTHIICYHTEKLKGVEHPINKKQTNLQYLMKKDKAIPLATIPKTDKPHKEAPEINKNSCELTGLLP